MKKRILTPILAAILIISLCACSKSNNTATKIDKNSTFSIHFIDVGQGDAALVECDGHYMLIDGGDTTSANDVYDTLVAKGVQHLDILAVSHLHKDHIGGLPKVLTYTTKIDLTLCNADEKNTEIFRSFEKELLTNGSQITIPRSGNAPGLGDTYSLGSATVEVIFTSAEDDNDSLVLLITYGDTRFLFTGDIEESAQTQIADKYQNDTDEPYKIDLIKMPHHGSYTGTLYRFLRTFMPDYAIISVGSGNQYGHPHQETLDLLNSKSWQAKVYRTDYDGDIVVRSDGRSLSIETSK
jgi:competence protein ComEC